MMKETERRTDFEADGCALEVPWNAFAVGASIVFYLGLNVAMVLAAPLFLPRIDPKHPPIRLFLYIQTFLNILFIGVVPLVLAWTTGARARTFGIERGAIVQYFGTGIAGGVIMFPLILLLNVGVMRLFGSKEHPVAELMKGDRSLSYMAFSFFSVVIVAPLAEELFFRVILQGWLEKAVARLRGTRPGNNHNHADTTIQKSESIKDSVDAGLDEEPRIAGVESDDATPDRVEGDRDRAAVLSDSRVVRGDWGKAADAGVRFEGGFSGDSARPDWIRFAPNVIASTGFALAHMTVWPTPIPLFVLSLGIGYVYSRTRSWAACAAMHATFNEINLLMLVIYLQAQPG